MLPEPKPWALREHFVMSSIRSREIARAQRPGVRHLEDALKVRDFGNRLISVHSVSISDMSILIVKQTGSACRACGSVHLPGRDLAAATKSDGSAFLGRSPHPELHQSLVGEGGIAAVEGDFCQCCGLNVLVSSPNSNAARKAMTQTYTK